MQRPIISRAHEIQEPAEIDVMALRPMEAINKLFLLREKAKNV